MKRPLRALITVGGLLLAGCAAPSDADLAKSVLAADPGFQATLTKKRETDAKIGELQNQLFTKKSEYDRQIRDLQAAYRAERDQLHQQVEDLVSQLDPDREQLRLELSTAAGALKSREAERRSLQRALQELRKSHGSQQPPAPPNPLAAQEEELTKRLSLIEQAVKDLTAQCQLLRGKLRLLRQERT